MWIKSTCTIREIHNNPLMENLKNHFSKCEKLSLWIFTVFLKINSFPELDNKWNKLPKNSIILLNTEKCYFATKYKTEESFMGEMRSFLFYISKLYSEETIHISILNCYVRRYVLKAMKKKLITHKSVIHNTSKLPSLIFPCLKLEYLQVLITCIHLLKISLSYAFILQ